MPSHQCSQTAVIQWLLFVCLLYSGSRLEAQIEAPAPVPTTEAPSKSKETSDDSEFKIHNYQLKHAKAAEVLKLFKQLHGGENTATVDERTNSIVFLAEETDALELRESLALLDGDALPPVIPPTPVVQRLAPEVRVPSKFESPNAKLRFRKFTFKHAKVADVVKILRELTGANIDNENMEGFAVDELTNSVIWKVKDEWSSRHWEETLLTLDGESSASKTQSAPSPYRHLANTPTPVDFPSSPNSQVSAQPTQIFTFSMGLERGESLDSLKQRYNVLEQKTHQLADKLKQSKSPGEPERTELQTAVRKSFEARQALQRAELADLAQRMKSMQQSIDMRDKLADKVIERRVEDLLNPNLKWDLTEPAAIAQRESSAKPKSIKEAVTEQIDVSKGKRADDSKQSPRQFTRRYPSPKELLDAVEQYGKSGSYEDFVTLFNDKGVRDLAGSLLMSALQLTGSVDLAKTQGSEASSGMDSGVSAVSEVLKRRLPQNANAEQLKAMHDALSTMWSAIGGASEDPSALKAFRISMRKSVEGITDHRKFCVEIMQAYEKLTTKPFVYFGNGDQKSDWQVTQFGDRATATLIDGSPGMATTITLQQGIGDCRISSLFNELVDEAQPVTASPNATGAEQSNAKMITRRYSVGSFVTEIFFTGKGNYDTKEVYEKYETEIEQSLQDLAKTVTATCTQPPKFVQVLSSSRCLLIGHTETGHQEIADFMSDIGINNDRIRLRGVGIEITTDDVKSLGIDLTRDFIQLLSSEKAEQLRAFQKHKKSGSENSSRDFSFVAMDEAIQSGARTHVKTSEVGLQFPFAARIVPGTKKVQIRMDFHSAPSGVEIFSPRIQSLSDAQSVLFVFGDDLYWLATAEIVQDAIVGSENNVKAPSNPLPSDTPAMDMQQRLQGEWDVKVMGFNHDDSDKRPYQAVVRGQLFLLQCMEDGKVIGTSTWKMIWPEADHPDVVDIVWDPDNNSDEHFCPGRVACDGKSFQVAWRSDDSISGPAIRPTQICSGEGVSYFECVRKQPADPSPTSMSSDVPVGPKYSGHPISWWLDSYWDNVTASPKAAENTAQEYVASEAIRKLREKPECKAAIEAALAKWFASVEHEVNEGNTGPSISV